MTPLTDAPLVAVVPPDFPWTEDVIPLERLLQETFLSCPEQYVARLLPPEAPRLEVTASDDAAILSMVAAGLGVSVLSAFSLAGYEGQVRVLPLAEPLSRRLGAAVKTPPSANSAVRYFLSFLKRQYPPSRRITNKRRSRPHVHCGHIQDKNASISGAIWTMSAASASRWSSHPGSFPCPCGTCRT